MGVIVDEFGLSVGKKSERLIIRKEGKIQKEVPLMDLEQVLITSRGVSISSDLIRECSERGIPIHFLNLQGTPYAQLSSANLVGTIQTRREQLLAFSDKRGLEFAKSCHRPLV